MEGGVLDWERNEGCIFDGRGVILLEWFFTK